jgi:hypothetical protein
LQAELEREREVKALEAQRHQQEVEAAVREAEEERRRHREAYLRSVLICSRRAVTVDKPLTEGSITLQRVQGQRPASPLIECSLSALPRHLQSPGQHCTQEASG